MSSTPEEPPAPSRSETAETRPGGERAAEPTPTQAALEKPDPESEGQVTFSDPAPPVYVGPPPRATNPLWRTEAAAPPLVVLLGAFIALFGGWAVFHEDGVGIGLALTGIGMLAVAMFAGGREDLAVRLPSAVLIAALWAVAAIRDAGWVVTLCAVAALLLTPLALAPQRRFTGMFAGALGYFGGLAAAIGWAGRGRPVRKVGGAGAGRTVMVILVTAVLLLVFGGLFAAADRNFADLLANLSPDTDPVDVFLRLVLAVVLFGLLLLWAFTALMRPDFDPEEPARPRTLSRFEIGVPLGSLNLLFAVFIAMQLRTYFGGEDYVMETAGLTFAEYARQGFWQLSVVAVLALAVIAIAAWFGPRRKRTDRWTLRLLLGGLCAMSLVVVASAALRMSVYFDMFGLTRMRMWVFTVEIWLAILFVLVLVCCWKLRASWLPRGILGSGALVLLGLAAINPDGFIASYNVDRFEDTGKLDVTYLQSLSADAAPALMELPEDERRCTMRWGDRDDWIDRAPLAWNLGYSRAAELKRDFRGVDSGVCRDHLGPGYDDDRIGGPGAPEPDPAEESTDVDAADYGFFYGDTCRLLDTTSADEMFGEDAKGGYGVEPDGARQSGTVFGNMDAEDAAPYASLECGYFGTGTGHLVVELNQWPTAERAEEALTQDRTYHSSTDYDVADLGSETMSGFTAVYDSPTYREYKYSFAMEDLVFEAVVTEGPVGDEARAVLEDLTDQLHELYLELA